MAEGFKLLLVAREDGDPASLRDWAKSLADTLPNVRRIELDLVDEHAQAVHTRGSHNPERPSSGPERPICDAVVSIWADAPPQEPPPGYAMGIARVRDRIGYGFEDDALGPVDGYKKLTFWCAKPGLAAEEWDGLYAHHIITVRHQQPIWRYRQNIISGVAGMQGFDALSENWWRTLHDLDGGFFLSEEAKQEVYAETSTFIDLPSSHSLVMRNEALLV